MSDRPEPIVVTGTLRCGSSLTARIFAEHGAWVGECEGPSKANPDGFYENLAIKSWVQRNVDPKDRSKILSQEHPLHPDFRTFLMATLKKESYQGGPWLVKHSVLYWRLWDQFSPRFVLPRRNLAEVFQSIRAAGYSSWASDDELKTALRRMDRRVLYLSRNRGGAIIDIAKMIGGDFTEVEAALKMCDIEPDHDLIASLINRSHWHGEVK